MLKKLSKNWITLLILALAGGLIYKLPYLKYSYYDALISALKVDNTQLGVLVSSFGLSSMICYFPGGWIADRFQPRVLLTTAFVSLGLLGLWYSTFPSYNTVLFIHIAFGAVICLCYWSVAIKAVRLLTSDDDTGKMFGFWEGGKQISGLIISYSALAVFARFDVEVLGVAAIIRIYSFILISVGVILFFMLKDLEQGKKTAMSPLEIFKVMKDPRAWAFALMIFSAYHYHIGLNNITPYLTQIFGLSSTTAAGISMFVMYVIGFFGAAMGGILVDKMKSTLKVVRYMIVLGICVLIAYILVPGSSSFLYVVIALWGVAQFANFAIRGVYFSSLKDLKVSKETTGLFVGFASFLGFLPDTFLHIVTGKIMDAYPGETGFKVIFAYMGVMLVVCLLVVTLMMMKSKKMKAQGNE